MIEFETKWLEKSKSLKIRLHLRLILEFVICQGEYDFYESKNLPHVTRAGADSSLIQNDIHETITHRTEGM